ncbi:MAG: tetratricopeptide repeat protein [Spirochaetales bacterium]|nr:tetratricopeptide repeat protein [Spirochaetales bacterium]
MKRLIILLVPLVICTAACSSKPDKGPDVYTKRNKAAEYAVYGNTYFDSAMYEQALGFFTMALELNISVDNQDGMTANYISAGKTLIALGKQEQGEEYLLKAVQLARNLGNPELAVLSLANAGEAYLQTGDVETGRPYIEEALELSATIPGGTETVAVLYHNAGVLAKYDGDLDRALNSFTNAASINKNLSRLTLLAANYYMISSIYSKLEKYDEALDFAHRALDNDKKTEHSYGIAKDIHALAIIHRKAGNHKESYEYFKKACLIYDTLRLKPELMEVLEALISMAATWGTEAEVIKFTQDYLLLKETP